MPSVKSRLKVVVTLLFVVCLLPVARPLAARAQTSAPKAEEADALYQARKWVEAAKAYDAITKAEPSNARAWFRQGVALQRQRKYAEAVASYERANEAGKATAIAPFVMYNLAATYARLNEREKALDWLGRSLAANLPGAIQLKSDPDFEALRATPRFVEFVKAAEKLAQPCMYTEGYRRFDFWVGEWDVFAGKRKVGYSNVKMLQQGCALEENWESAGTGGTGKSLNFYNPVTRKWHQSYMGSGGDNWMMDGEYKDGALRYAGSIYTPGGAQTPVHMTFVNLEPGKVRQWAETSADGGKTWQTTWDAIYIRRRADAGVKRR
jgi:tetratricopeptide (TPR) repeat protein